MAPGSATVSQPRARQIAHRVRSQPKLAALNTDRADCYDSR
jgi:hypothetical protein